LNAIPAHDWQASRWTAGTLGTWRKAELVSVHFSPERMKRHQLSSQLADELQQIMDRIVPGTY
jgi:hypothetical protein